MLKQQIRHLIMRPEMHAQNVGSLEDQFVLLIGLIDTELQNSFIKFCRDAGCGNSTLSSQFKTFAEMQVMLEQFCELHLS